MRFLPDRALLDYSLNRYALLYLFTDCVGVAKMLRRSYLFEILCKRAQNRACSSSAECSQDYLKTMQEGRRSSPLGPHKAERKCLVEELLQPKQPVFSWLKFLCEALGKVESQDQAACIFDALAWSFEQNRVSDPLCIFDAQGV